MNALRLRALVFERAFGERIFRLWRRRASFLENRDSHARLNTRSRTRKAHKLITIAFMSNQFIRLTHKHI